MRFFTADLFVRFNSPDDEVADRADEEWEAAIREYRGHLHNLGERMPSHVRQLADLSLHDAEVLAEEERSEPLFHQEVPPFPVWSAFAILSVRTADEIVSLIYLLCDHVRRIKPSEDWPFSSRGRQWLYDEIDVSSGQPQTFVHRILLSDGTVVEVPFVSVVVHRFALPRGRARVQSRRAA